MLRPVNGYKCQGLSLRSKNSRKYIIKDKTGDKSAPRKRAIYTCHKGENSITCNCSASERERICLLAGRALPKSINTARGGCPFLCVIRTLPGLTSLCAYGGSKLCICLSPAQSCKCNCKYSQKLTTINASKPL